MAEISCVLISTLELDEYTSDKIIFFWRWLISSNAFLLHAIEIFCLWIVLHGSWMWSPVCQ